MNRILLAEGLAHTDMADKSVRLHEGLKSEAIDDLRCRISARLNAIEAQSLMGLSLEMLNQLRDHGIVTTTVDALDQIPKFDRDELEQLLAKLSAWVTETQSDRTDTVSIIDTTQRVRCPLADIVKLILGGKLTYLNRDAEKCGLAALRVNLPELRAALPQFEMPGVTKGDASRRLRVNYPTINFLIADGVLIERRLRNPRSRQFLDAVCSTSLTAFEAKFETLGQLSKRYHRASGPFGCHLEAKGICPIETPAGISWYYERKGLEGRLRRAGLIPQNEKEPT